MSLVVDTSSSRLLLSPSTVRTSRPLCACPGVSDASHPSDPHAPSCELRRTLAFSLPPSCLPRDASNSLDPPQRGFTAHIRRYGVRMGLLGDADEIARNYAHSPSSPSWLQRRGSLADGGRGSGGGAREVLLSADERTELDGFVLGQNSRRGDETGAGGHPGGAGGQQQEEEEEEETPFVF